MERVQNQHESKRKLLDAALRVIRTRGYQATRVEDVCEAAGLTKGSFFHHFTSKEDLALAAAEHWNAVTGALFASAPYRELADPLDRLLAYIDFRKALLRGELPEFTCLVGTMVQEIYATNPQLREACERSIRGHAETLQPDIAAAVKKYGVDAEWTAQSLALYMQAVIQGSFILAKAKGGPEAAAASLDHLRRYFELLFRKSESRETPGGDTMTTPSEKPLQLNLEPETVQWPETHYVFIEKQGPFPTIAPQAWTELHALTGAIAEHNTITGYMSLYRMGPGIYRAGVSVAAKPTQLPAGVAYENFAGGKYARFVLTGSYAQLGPATGKVVETVRERGLPLRDDFHIEHYVNDPRVTTEEQLITHILFPVA